MPRASRCTGTKDTAGYPQMNESASRMALAMELDGIEVVTPSDGERKASNKKGEDSLMFDPSEALQAHAKTRRSKKGTVHSLSPDETVAHLRKRKICFWAMVGQGILLPIIFFTLAFTLADHPTPCTVGSVGRLANGFTEPNLMSYLFMIPGGAALVLMSMVLYSARGPGGYLEKKGAPLGCLPCTAVQPEE